MSTTTIRNKVQAYMEVGFTMTEAFRNIKDAQREVGRKTNKVAEARAKAEEKNGTTQYGNFGKEYGNRKLGKQ
jgi:hypothetical protein